MVGTTDGTAVALTTIGMPPTWRAGNEELIVLNVPPMGGPKTMSPEMTVMPTSTTINAYSINPCPVSCLDGFRVILKIPSPYFVFTGEEHAPGFI